MSHPVTAALRRLLDRLLGRTYAAPGWEPGAPGWDPDMLRRYYAQTTATTSTKASA